MLLLHQYYELPDLIVKKDKVVIAPKRARGDAVG
jgi:hypothetical protein